MSEGRRALLRVLRTTHARFIALRCRVTIAAVYNWSAGRRRPCKRCRIALESYQIPRDRW